MVVFGIRQRALMSVEILQNFYPSMGVVRACDAVDTCRHAAYYRRQQNDGIIMCTLEWFTDSFRLPFELWYMAAVSYWHIPSFRFAAIFRWIMCGRLLLFRGIQSIQNKQNVERMWREWAKWRRLFFAEKEVSIFSMNRIEKSMYSRSIAKKCSLSRSIVSIVGSHCYTYELGVLTSSPSITSNHFFFAPLQSILCTSAFVNMHA